MLGWGKNSATEAAKAVKTPQPGSHAPADHDRDGHQVDGMGAVGHAETGPDDPPARWAAPADVAAKLKLNPEAEAELLAEDFLPDNSPVFAGKLRAALGDDETAHRFLLWVYTVGRHGHLTDRALHALFHEFCENDHREPIKENNFRDALKRCHGVRRQNPRVDGKRRVLWTIDAPKRPRKPKAPKPASADVPEQAHSTEKRLIVPEREHSEPIDFQAIRKAKAHEKRRIGRARKQRGHRAGRRAA